MLDRLTLDRERIGPVNLVAEQELAELDEARTKGAEEAEELTQAIHRLRGSIGNLNREGRVRLLDAYKKVERISGGSSRPCSKEVRRTLSWSRATIRSRQASKSWPSRRASACRR